MKEILNMFKDIYGKFYYITHRIPEGALILAYHSVSHDNEAFFSIKPKTFERQMSFLRKHRWNIISLSELLEILEAGTEIPRKTVVITFDDAYSNNKEHAMPVIEKYKIPITLFVPTSFVGKKMTNRENHTLPIMEWGDIVDLGKNPLVTIGSHTRTHPDLRTMTDNDVDQELSESKEELSSKLGYVCDILAYPKGRNNITVLIHAKKHYRAAVATHDERVTHASDIFCLPRRGVFRYTSFGKFLYLISR